MPQVETQSVSRPPSRPTPRGLNNCLFAVVSFPGRPDGDGLYEIDPNGGMILPGGVAVLPRGRGSESVFVAGLFSLREFDAQTGRQRSIERVLTGYSKLISPVFTVAPDGNRLLLS